MIRLINRLWQKWKSVSVTDKVSIIGAILTGLGLILAGFGTWVSIEVWQDHKSLDSLSEISQSIKTTNEHLEQEISGVKQEVDILKNQDSSLTKILIELTNQVDLTRSTLNNTNYSFRYSQKAALISLQKKDRELSARRGAMRMGFSYNNDKPEHISFLEADLNDFEDIRQNPLILENDAIRLETNRAIEVANRLLLSYNKAPFDGYTQEAAEKDQLDRSIRFEAYCLKQSDSLLTRITKFIAVKSNELRVKK